MKVQESWMESWLGGRLGRRHGRAETVSLLAVAIVSTAWLLAGCGINVGPTTEFAVDESLGSAALTDVEVSMGAGKLNVAPGAAGLASGTIRYNVEPWKPVLTRTDAGLTLRQGSQKGISGLGTGVVNQWDLQLGKAPMRLRVTAGAYDGSYDLSGLTLQGLTIKDGAAKSKVMFNSPNPGQMDSLDYSTGASTVTFVGLANANFKSMKFAGGAGSYSFDFSGQLRTDAAVKIEVGAGSVRIKVPAATAARVVIEGSLNNVDTEGVWTVADHTYSTPAAGTASQGKSLAITVKMNVGSVTLVAE